MNRKDGLLLLLVVVGWTAVPALPGPPPQPHACDPAKWEGNLPAFCDTTLSLDQRIDDLVSRLDVDEKIAMLVNTADAIPSQGLPGYQWWSDAQHGLAYAPGVQFCPPTPVATSFPQVITTAQTFNTDLMRAIGSAISTEGRVFSNYGTSSLTFWDPNINIFRDPRWGRGEETPGEDPLLNAAYAVNFVRGLQEGEDPRFLKSSACCKHFAAYSMEDLKNGTDRHNFDAQVTAQDLADTYLPAFEACVIGGRASGIMCSYNRINGVPSCANQGLLNGLARGRWGFDGYITSDCDAVADILLHHNYTHTPEETCQATLRAGTDVDCSQFYKTYLPSALASGAVETQDLNVALGRLLRVQFRLGLFDPLDEQVYRKYDLERVNSAEHQQLALEAARQGIVLLKNAGEALPLDAGRGLSVVVIGPHANAGEAMQGNYFGVPPFLISPVEGIRQYVPGAVLAVGCGLNESRGEDLAKAVKATQEADVTVLVLGMDRSIEDETRDRVDIYLPGPQEELAQAILKEAKGPVILVLIAGGALDITNLLQDSRVPAVLFAGYPGQSGGQALADILFGEVNPSGRLTQTFYPNEYTAQIEMADMHMRPDTVTGRPGRTYRFYTGPVIFPFGYGLSYTQFEVRAVSCGSSLPHGGKRLTLTRGISSATDEHSDGRLAPMMGCFSVKNMGARIGRYIALAFLVPPNLAGVSGAPVKSLCAFGSVVLAPQQAALIQVPLTQVALSLADAEGQFHVVSGQWTLLLDNVEQAIEVPVGVGDIASQE